MPYIAYDGAMIHVSRPEIEGYLARVRRAGCRKYELIGKPKKSLGRAMTELARAMATGNFKRGDVLCIPNPMSYYGPHAVYETVQL